MDGTGSLFAPFLEHAPDAFDTRVVAYPCDVGDTSVLVTRAFDSLPTGEPFVIVAESFSGPIALTLAERRPVGLRAVVLCASFVTNPVPQLPTAIASLVRAPLFAATPTRLVVAALLGASGTPALRARLGEALGSVPPDVLAQRARASLRTDARGALIACGVPLLVLRATNDRVVAASCAREIIAVRPDAVLREVAAPHLLLQVAPVAAWAEIARFTAGLS